MVDCWFCVSHSACIQGGQDNIDSGPRTCNRVAHAFVPHFKQQPMITIFTAIRPPSCTISPAIHPHKLGTGPPAPACDDAAPACLTSELLSLPLTLLPGALLLASRGGGTSDAAAVPGLLQDHHPAAVKRGARMPGEATGAEMGIEQAGEGSARVRTHQNCVADIILCVTSRCAN